MCLSNASNTSADFSCNTVWIRLSLFKKINVAFGPLPTNFRLHNSMDNRSSSRKRHALQTDHHTVHWEADELYMFKAPTFHNMSSRIKYFQICIFVHCYSACIPLYMDVTILHCLTFAKSYNVAIQCTKCCSGI